MRWSCGARRLPAVRAAGAAGVRARQRGLRAETGREGGAAASSRRFDAGVAGGRGYGAGATTRAEVARTHAVATDAAGAGPGGATAGVQGRREVDVPISTRRRSPDLASCLLSPIGYRAYTETVTDDFALYVHIPFCTAKCTYCDFNSYAGQVLADGALCGGGGAGSCVVVAVDAGRKVGTVFFGGGTPSLLPLEHMATIVRAMRARFEFAADAEVSLEANPGTVDSAHLRGLRSWGSIASALACSRFMTRSCAAWTASMMRAR